jgi:3'-5' exonuclease
MNRLVFDIETLAFPLEQFDEVQQEYLLRFAQDDEQRTEALQKLNLYPLTARIIAIGLLNPDTNHGKILYQADTREQRISDDGQIEFLSGTESDLLAGFWDVVTKYDQFITFNGRAFDCPFIMLRSAICGVQPTRNLNPYRYDSRIHCDLLDQLSYYGATKKFNLDFYCKQFGIESPKSHGISGLDMGTLFAQERFKEIAEYCLGDIKATALLFRKWNTFLNFDNHD